MGNRVYFSTVENKKTKTYYLHWNGCAETFMPLMAGALAYNATAQQLMNAMENDGLKAEFQSSSDAKKWTEENGHWKLDFDKKVAYGKNDEESSFVAIDDFKARFEKHIKERMVETYVSHYWDHFYNLCKPAEQPAPEPEKPKRKFVELEQGTPEWLAFRQNGIGASDIAAIMGVSPYSKKEDVLAAKLGKTKEISSYQQRIFDDGHACEKVVRDNINATTDLGFKPCVLVYQEEGKHYAEKFFASLDGLSESQESILEVKSTSSQDRFNQFKAGEERLDFLYQVQWQMMCANVEAAILVLTMEGISCTRSYSKDADLQQKLRNQAVLFLADLETAKMNQLEVKDTAVDEIDVSDLHEIRHLEHLKECIESSKKYTEQLEEELSAGAKKLMERFHGAKKLYAANGIIIENVERAGSVDYSKVPELKGVNLESYRKPTTKYIRVSMKKTLSKNELTT